MTKVKITLETEENILGVFLHHPGQKWPEPLPGASHTVERKLADGLYHVALSGTGLHPGAPVTVTFATDSDSEKRTRAVYVDGTLAELIPFQLTGQDVQ